MAIRHDRNLLERDGLYSLRNLHQHIQLHDWRGITEITGLCAIGLKKTSFKDDGSYLHVLSGTLYTGALSLIFGTKLGYENVRGNKTNFYVIS